VVKSKVPTISFNNVDLPAPLAPTIAILDSQSIFKLHSFKIILSALYPNEPSSTFKRGGFNYSGVGNLNTHSGS